MREFEWRITCECGEEAMFHSEVESVNWAAHHVCAPALPATVEAHRKHDWSHRASTGASYCNDCQIELTDGIEYHFHYVGTFGNNGFDGHDCTACAIVHDGFTDTRHGVHYHHKEKV